MSERGSKLVCSQLEDELEERDSMDWLEDHEMMRRWEGVIKEGKITMKRNEGREE